MAVCDVDVNVYKAIAVCPLIVCPNASNTKSFKLSSVNPNSIHVSVSPFVSRSVSPAVTLYASTNASRAVNSLSTLSSFDEFFQPVSEGDNPDSVGSLI